MLKLTPRGQGLKESRAAAVALDPLTAAPSSRTTPGSRSGRVLVGGHFALEVQRALRPKDSRHYPHKSAARTRVAN
jgi:hypothetical protein